MVTLELKDSHYPDQDLGSLELSVTLGPKDSPVEEPKDCKVIRPPLPSLSLSHSLSL